MTEKTDHSDPNSHDIGSLVKGLLKQTGFERQVHRFSVFEDWSGIVGDKLAVHSQPLRMRGDVLEVRVDHAIWMQQLQWRKVDILRNINARLESDPVSDIFWRFGMLKPTAPDAESG